MGHFLLSTGDIRVPGKMGHGGGGGRVTWHIEVLSFI